MLFRETPLSGAFVVDPETHEDSRGSFYRSYCSTEFEKMGLPGGFVQCSISRNRTSGTVRGMHFQADPRPECKLVRCVRGSVYDVIIDLRRQSPTFCKWFGAELSEENGSALYVPAGFAHGIQTLTDDAHVLYQMNEYYVAELTSGVRWNDPAFGIVWPREVSVISDRDRTLANYR